MPGSPHHDPYAFTLCHAAELRKPPVDSLTVRPKRRENRQVRR